MQFKDILFLSGSVIVAGFFVYGFVSAYRLEKSARSHRIPIITLTRALDFASLLTGLTMLFMAGTLTFSGEQTDSTLWLTGEFLLLAALFGFPRGVLYRPGLLPSGLVFMGQLYPWGDFSGFEARDKNRFHLLYAKPMFGFRGLTVCVAEDTREAFRARLAESLGGSAPQGGSDEAGN